MGWYKSPVGESAWYPHDAHVFITLGQRKKYFHEDEEIPMVMRGSIFAIKCRYESGSRYATKIMQRYLRLRKITVLCGDDWDRLYRQWIGRSIKKVCDKWGGRKVVEWLHPKFHFQQIYINGEKKFVEKEQLRALKEMAGISEKLKMIPS